jgi:hypothetical protein
VDNLVPLSSQLADNKATEQFIHLLGFNDRNTLLGLENFLLLEKLLLCSSFSASVVLSSGNLKSGFISLVTSINACNTDV